MHKSKGRDTESLSEPGTRLVASKHQPFLTLLAPALVLQAHTVTAVYRVFCSGAWILTQVLPCAQAPCLLNHLSNSNTLAFKGFSDSYPWKCLLESDLSWITGKDLTIHIQ